MRVKAPGGIDQLELIDIPVPTPAPGEVLVQVKAAGLDRGTEHLMTGKPYAARLGFGLRRPKNPVPGRDVAGIVAEVPFVDVLATMLDDKLPLTPPEWPEWGNPIEDKAAFDLIRSYSPYDQVRPQAYPPLLVTAGLNDPRVTYWEPAKWVAKLRELKTDDNLLLMKTNMGAGHGGQSGRWNSLKETAEEFAFILWQMGMAPKTEGE